MRTPGTELTSRYHTCGNFSYSSFFLERIECIMTYLFSFEKVFIVFLNAVYGAMLWLFSIHIYTCMLYEYEVVMEETNLVKQRLSICAVLSIEFCFVLLRDRKHNIITHISSRMPTVPWENCEVDAFIECICFNILDYICPSSPIKNIIIRV